MKDHLITLDDHELNIVREASEIKGLHFNPDKRQYSSEELTYLGIVRESYSLQELHERDFTSSGVVTSFDEVARRAEEELRVGAPFAKTAKKWQLPIDVMGFRIIKTVFPPDTIILPHTHSVLDPDVKSGGFRMVVKGSITFEGQKFEPGDWFFVPNGTPYSFKTDPNIETEENYWYGHRHRDGLARISSPKAVKSTS